MAATGVNHLLQKLQDALALKTDTPPPEFLSNEQWAAKWKVSNGHAHKLLVVGVTKGWLQRRKFRISCPCGARLVWHYAEIKSAF